MAYKSILPPPVFNLSRNQCGIECDKPFEYDTTTLGFGLDELPKATLLMVYLARLKETLSGSMDRPLKLSLVEGVVDR